MPKICKNCRLQYNDNAQLCGKCGSPLVPSQPRSPTQQNQYQMPHTLPRQPVNGTSNNKKATTTKKIAISIISVVVAASIVVCGVIFVPKIIGNNDEGGFGNLLSDSSDNNAKGNSNLKFSRTYKTLITSGACTVAVKDDGTVIATEFDNDYYNNGQTNTSGWADIIAIDGNGSHTYGLKSDGTVVVTDYTKTDLSYNERLADVTSWTDIAMISCSHAVVGLKKDGTVVATGCNEHGECDVSGWTDIVHVISTDDHKVIGIKSNGTVVVAGRKGFDIENWTDIVDITIGYNYALGVKSNGTVVCDAIETADDSITEEILSWKNIVDIKATNVGAVGLKADGTIVATSNICYFQEISDWSNIVAFDADQSHIIALNSDGTVLGAGYDFHGDLGAIGWTNIKIPE